MPTTKIKKNQQHCYIDKWNKLSKMVAVQEILEDCDLHTVVTHGSLRRRKAFGNHNTLKTTSTVCI